MPSNIEIGERELLGFLAGIVVTYFVLRSTKTTASAAAASAAAADAYSLPPPAPEYVAPPPILPPLPVAVTTRYKAAALF